MLKYAVKWGYLGMNPAAEVKAPRVESEEMDALTPEEVRHLLTGVSEEDGEPLIKPGWYVPIKLAIFSGLRQGEPGPGESGFESVQHVVVATGQPVPGVMRRSASHPVRVSVVEMRPHRPAELAGLTRDVTCENQPVERALEIGQGC